MTARPVLIMLVITCLLAVTAYFVVAKPASVTPAGVVAGGERLAEIDPAAITRIEVENPGQPVQVLERDATDPELWRLTSHGGAVIEPVRVRSLLRLVAEGRSNGVPRGETAGVGDASPVRLTLSGRADTPQWRLEFARAGVGGQRRVAIARGGGTPRVALAGDELFSVLTSPGPVAWRDTAVFGDAALRASGVTLTLRNGTIEITSSRAAGASGWVMVQPAAARGAPLEPAAVSTMLKGLTDVRVARFPDAPPAPQVSGLESPQGTIAVQFDGGRGKTLLIGNPADAQGTTLFAAERSDGGAAAAPYIIDTLSISKLLVEPTTLIARNASRVPPADVGRIVLTAGGRTLALTREGAAWTEQFGDEKPVALDPAKAQASEEAFAVLTTKAADAVTVAGEALAATAITATLQSPGGSPLEELTLARWGEGVTVRTGKIERRFKTAPAELKRWMATLAG